MAPLALRSVPCTAPVGAPVTRTPRGRPAVVCAAATRNQENGGLEAGRRAVLSAVLLGVGQALFAGNAKADEETSTKEKARLAAEKRRAKIAERSAEGKNGGLQTLKGSSKSGSSDSVPGVTPAPKAKKEESVGGGLGASQEELSGATKKRASKMKEKYAAIRAGGEVSF